MERFIAKKAYNNFYSLLKEAFQLHIHRNKYDQKVFMGNQKIFLFNLISIFIAMLNFINRYNNSAQY